jgi:hypothetical protein
MSRVLTVVIVLMLGPLLGLAMAQDASWSTDNPHGSLRLLLQGNLSHRIPAGLPGVLAVPIQSQHPPPPPAGEVYYYLMPNGFYLLTSAGKPQLIGPSVPEPSIHVKVGLAIAQSIPPKTETLILWSKVDWDTGGFYETVNPGRIKITQSGTYAMLCGLQFEKTAHGVMEIYARKGSGETIGRDNKTAIADRDTRVGLETEDIFAAGEVMEILGSHTATEPRKVLPGSGTFCSMKRTG